MQAGLQTRYTIYEILRILRINTVGFDEVFLEKVENKNFKVSDRKMIHNVVLNSMRYYLFIDEVIKQFSNKLNKSSNSYYLLLSAITQLLILNFKDFAVINSTVELAKDKRINAPTKFINAILRNINRNKSELSKINYNFSKLPLWFTKRVSSWNTNQKNKFIRTICEEPDLHIVFKNKKDINKITSNKIQTSDHSIVIKKSISIKNIEGFKEGLWWVQDFAAMMPLYLIKNIKNKYVADVCAAPGGKTFQLLSYGAKVKAIEKSSKRMEIMKKNLRRLKFNCEVEINDFQKLNDKQKYDLIVLDAPCSSIGTIRRHPEIFFRKKFPDLNKITLMQTQLLEKSKSLLKKNSYLIYMVCSFLQEEGKIQIKNFLKQNKNFSHIKFSSNLTKYTNNFTDKNGFYYVIPSKLDNNVLIDGFFAAILKKNV